MKFIEGAQLFTAGALCLSMLSCSPVTSPKPSAPDVPTGVTATAGNGHILISWTAVTGAASYNVYYAVGSTVSKLGSRINTTTSPYDLINLTNATKYAIAVSAVNTEGESDLSVVDTATPMAPAETANITLGLSDTVILAGGSIDITGTVDASSQPTVAYTIEPITAASANGIAVSATTVTGKNKIDLQSDAHAHITTSTSTDNGTYAVIVTVIVGSSTFSKRDTFAVTKPAWFISDVQETQMGDTLYRRMVADTKNYPLYAKDQRVVDYVQNLGHALASSQTLRPENADFHYKFDVIDNDTIVNAFAIPGGHTFVYSGLILKAHNEAELAGVMFHELAHVIMRHGIRALVVSYSVDFLNRLIAGDTSVIRQTAEGLLFLKYSQSNEYEADSLSCELLNLDHYNPYGMPDFLQVLENLYGDYPSPWEFTNSLLSDHPLTSGRITATKRIIGRMTSPDTSAAALYASRLTPIVQYIQSH